MRKIVGLGARFVGDSDYNDKLTVQLFLPFGGSYMPVRNESVRVLQIERRSNLPQRS